jgi:preprotein translocase subunit SecD
MFDPRFRNTYILFGLLICGTFIGIYFIANLNRFMKFGIDLVGGTYITLEVQHKKAFEEEAVRKVRALHSYVAGQEGAQAVEPVKQLIDGASATITYKSPQEASRVAEKVTDSGVGFETAVNNDIVTYTIPASEIKQITKQAVENNIHVLRTRLDGIGVGEIPITAQGEKEIVVELPNVDIQQAKAMIGKTAMLEFKPVEDSGSSREEIEDHFGGTLPDHLMVIPGKRDAGASFFAVPKIAEVSGRMLKNARGDIGGKTGAEPTILFELNAEGARAFAKLTRESIGRRIAIIIDNEILMAPGVNEEIGSGSGMITGGFSVKDASALARMLKSGAFSAPVSFEQERHMSATLGGQSIRQGLIACLVGLLLLFIFSVGFYKAAGLVAFIVLLYNLLLTLFGLWMIGATLTLPGIAGMVLSIGMAIDASVLIYERIREELAIGLSLGKAIDTGFSDALAVILDANITHFLVASVLFYFGTGPIKGFAITMIIGIIATLLTGLLLLKFLLKFIVNVLGLHNLRF